MPHPEAHGTLHITLVLLEFVEAKGAIRFVLAPEILAVIEHELIILLDVLAVLQKHTEHGRCELAALQQVAILVKLESEVVHAFARARLVV